MNLPGSVAVGNFVLQISYLRGLFSCSLCASMIGPNNCASDSRRRLSFQASSCTGRTQTITGLTQLRMNRFGSVPPPPYCRPTTVRQHPPPPGGSCYRFTIHGTLRTRSPRFISPDVIRCHQRLVPGGAGGSNPILTLFVTGCWACAALRTANCLRTYLPAVFAV
jgi:hypothetical protein